MIFKLKSANETSQLLKKILRDTNRGNSGRNTGIDRFYQGNSCRACSFSSALATGRMQKLKKTSLIGRSFVELLATVSCQLSCRKSLHFLSCLLHLDLYRSSIIFLTSKCHLFIFTRICLENQRSSFCCTHTFKFLRCPCLPSQTIYQINGFSI